MEHNIENFLCGRHFKCMLDKQRAEIREKYSLKEIEIDVLLYLSKCGDKNTGRDMLSYLRINKGYLSQVMDRLNRNGFVVPLNDENDRRYIHYYLTEKSLMVVDEVETMRKKINKRLFAGLTEEEIETLRRAAQKIGMNIQDIIKNGL